MKMWCLHSLKFKICVASFAQFVQNQSVPLDDLYRFAHPTKVLLPLYFTGGTHLTVLKDGFLHRDKMF